jgi:hypothetical protein
MPQDSFPQGHLGYLFVFRMMKETMGCCLLECYRNIHPAHISHVREELQEKKIQRENGLQKNKKTTTREEDDFLNVPL